MLAGEADTTLTERLRKLLVSQMWQDGQRRLTVDVSELSFLDSSIVVVFVIAANALTGKNAAGSADILRPDG